MCSKHKKHQKLADIEMPAPPSKAAYNKKLAKLQRKLQATQVAVVKHQIRGIIVMEGWDAGGKGGAIRRMAWVLDPRSFSVHPIAAPQPADSGRHYLRRFWLRIPGPGEITVFDRSWYGRVLVERVENLIPKKTWKRGYQEIRDFEKLLTDDDFRICKIFLHITPKEQLKRFQDRFRNPLKSWKLTPEDLRNREKWPQYEDAINDMLAETSTPNAPWHVVAGDNKYHARLECLKLVIRTMTSGLDLSLPLPHPEIIASAKKQLGIDPQELGISQR